MCGDQLSNTADLACAARRILQAHIRMIDGRCRGCFVEHGRWVPHPCTPVDFAARVIGHDMTARFLSA